MLVIIPHINNFGQHSILQGDYVNSYREKMREVWNVLQSGKSLNLEISLAKLLFDVEK